jgi:hypothetical protein
VGVQRTSFSKLQRDRDKKAKAAAKRERRQERSAEAAARQPVDQPSDGELSAAELLASIEAIHQSYEAGTITYEDFEEKKLELLARLPVD